MLHKMEQPSVEYLLYDGSEVQKIVERSLLNHLLLHSIDWAIILMVQKMEWLMAQSMEWSS